MSLTTTWIVVAWTAAGAATAGTLRTIGMTTLSGTTPSRSSHMDAGARVDTAPRPPPNLGVNVVQTVVTAILFGLLAWRFGPHLDLLAYSLLAAAAVRLSVIDMLEMRLPRHLVLPLYPACLALFGLTAAVNDDGPRFGRAVTGMAVLFGAYFATAVLSRGGLGAGDVRAAGPIGLALAWLSWSVLLVGTLLSLLCFTATAVLSPSTTDSFRQREAPFGPSMFAGTFLAILT